MENDGFDSRSHPAFGDVVLNNGHIFVDQTMDQLRK